MKKTKVLIALLLIATVVVVLAGCSDNGAPKSADQKDATQKTADAPKVETPKVEPPKAEAPKPEPKKAEAPKPEGKVVFEANFDDGKLDGWELIGSVTADEKFIKIVRTDEDAATHTPEEATFSRAEKRFDNPLTGKVTFDFKFMTPDTSDGIKVFMIFDSTDGQEDANSNIFRMNVNKKAKVRIPRPEGESAIDVFEPAEANKWYNAMIVLDVDASTADLYIDGEKLGDKVPFENPVKDVAGFRGNIHGNNIGTYCLDDIKIYN